MKFDLCREPEMLGGAWFTTASCPRFPLHVQEELELNLVVHGTMTVIAEGERYRAERGDLVWLPPGCVHGPSEQSPDLVMWVVSIRPGAIELARRIERGVDTMRPARTRLSSAAFSGMSVRCFALLRAQREVGQFNRLLVELLVETSKACQHGGPKPEELHPAVRSAALRLARPGEMRVPLTRLAKQVALNPHQLSRLFHKQLGVTLVHYANHERVQLFGRLYAEQPSASTLQIALEAGFGSYSQFFRIFRAVTNWSPNQFRSLCESGKLPNLADKLVTPR